MVELFDDNSQDAIMDCVDWSKFGFDDRNGLQSTLWVGSEGIFYSISFFSMISPYLKRVLLFWILLLLKGELKIKGLILCDALDCGNY